MRKLLVVVAVAGTLYSWTLCSIAVGGPNHESAMAVVQEGESVSGTGKLGAAMEVYKSVEEEFPEEYEAIGWAKYRISGCLVAEVLWSEALRPAGEAWGLYEDGKVENLDPGFWAGYQYARCLDRTVVLAALVPGHSPREGEDDAIERGHAGRGGSPGAAHQPPAAVRGHPWRSGGRGVHASRVDFPRRVRG